MNFQTEHDEVNNQMICIYSHEYKSVTDKSTGDTKLFSKEWKS